MKKNSQEIECSKVEIFSSMKQISESESHIFRNVLIGIIITFVLGIGIIMLLATVFAEACATTFAN